MWISVGYFRLSILYMDITPYYRILFYNIHILSIGIEYKWIYAKTVSVTIPRARGE